MKNGKYLINFENFYDIKGIYKLLEKKIKTEKNIYKEELKEKIKRKNNLQVNDEFIEDLIKTFSISHSLNNSKKQLKEDMNLTEDIYQLLIKAISKNQINNFKTIENKVHNFISRDIKTPEVLWDDIIGLSKIKEKLKEISILFSLDKNQLEEYKIKKQKGFILYGSPGVGKTMLCEAFAKEIGGIFIYKSMNELISYFKDNEMNGQSKIKFLYENLISSIGENYNNVPIVVFLDEIDSIRARGESAHNNSYYDGITNDFLFAIDQIKNKHNIITIGATNSRDNLDKAMIRNGRLGIQIEIKNNFTKKEVYKFIKKELKNIKNISKKSCKILSDFCFYRDGNEINEILNNFKFKTLIKNKELNKQEIIEIVYETIYEINDFSNISKKDKKETAFHEAGHAFFTKLLNKKNKINEVTIYPTKKTLGYVKFTNSSSSQTKEDLENQIIILLAGRYSEKIISKSISAGASSDLSMANKIIHKLIMNYGMNKKHFNLAELKGREYRDLSEYQKEKIDKASNLILKNLSNITENLISKNKEKISKIAKKLIKENVIFNKDIEI
jgi:cell division protease FtsH